MTPMRISYRRCAFLVDAEICNRNPQRDDTTMSDTPAKYPIPRDLVERVHVKFITEEQKSISKQDAICRVLERYLEEKPARKKGQGP